MKLGKIEVVGWTVPVTLISLGRFKVVFTNGAVQGFGIHKFTRKIYVAVGKYALCFKLEKSASN